MGQYDGNETGQDGLRGGSSETDLKAIKSWQRRGFALAVSTGLLLLAAFVVAVMVDTSSERTSRYQSALDEAETADSEEEQVLYFSPFAVDVHCYNASSTPY